MLNFFLFKKPKKDAPTTIFPKTFPEIHNKIVWFKTLSDPSSDNVLVSLGPKDAKYDSEFRVNVEYMTRNLQIVDVPKNALAVSYSVDGFVVGKSCHDFFPKHRSMPEDSFFTYKMLSDRLQATYYNEGGVEYLAGVCFYNRSREPFSVTLEAFDHAIGIKESYPPAEVRGTVYGRNCKGKRVRVMKNEGEDAMHCVRDRKSGKDELKECAECREDAKVYEAELNRKRKGKEMRIAHEEYMRKVEEEGPVVPESKEKLPWKHCARYNPGKDMVKLEFSPVHDAHDDSVAFIQDYVRKFWPKTLDEVTIPKNAVTVGLIMEGCFYQVIAADKQSVTEQTEQAPTVTKTLSKNCEARYRTHDEVDYLAEIIYSLQPTDCSLITTAIDRMVMDAAVRESALFVGQDRWKSRLFLDHRSYSRHCETAGEQVSVLFEEGKEPVHQSFNYRTLEWKYEECEECREEAKTYKFEEGEDAPPTPGKGKEGVEEEVGKKKQEIHPAPAVTPQPVEQDEKPGEYKENKADSPTSETGTEAPKKADSNDIVDIEKGYPLTSEDTIPAEIWKKIKSLDLCGTNDDEDYRVALYLGDKGVQNVHDQCVSFIQWMASGHWGCTRDELFIPRNAVMICFVMEDFCFGRPQKSGSSDLKKKPKSHFITRRKISENCHAEYWNENGTEYLVQIVYCLQTTDCSVINTLADELAMKAAIRESTLIRRQDRWKSWVFETFRSYGRHCKTAGEQVSVLFEEGKEPVHQSYNYRRMEWEYEECEECREEAKTYKFEEAEDTPPTLETGKEGVKEEVEKKKQEVHSTPVAVEQNEKPGELFGRNHRDFIAASATVAPIETEQSQMTVEEEKEGETLGTENLPPTATVTQMDESLELLDSNKSQDYFTAPTTETLEDEVSSDDDFELVDPADI